MWLSDVVLGRLGVSYYFRVPVMDVLLPSLPATLELIFATSLWAIVLGGLLGWAAASRRFRALDPVARGAGLLLYALPLFWITLLVVIGAVEAWKVVIGSPLAPDPTRPRPTGFPFLDALLSGNLAEAWLVFWTSALLTLPAGAVLGLPILLRVRNALRRARDAPGLPGQPWSTTPSRSAPLRSVLASVAGGVALILPFVVSATVFEEWFGNRRGLGWFVFLGFQMLDVPLLQGALLLLVLLALLAALPFALLEAGLLREPAGPPVPRVVPDSTAVESGLRAVEQRLLGRPGLVFWAGLVLFAIPVLLTVAAPVLTPYGPLQPVTDAACSGSGGSVFLQPPCPSHPLGTNYFGFDVLSQVLYGGGLFMAETALALAVSAGIALGLALLCGVVGRWIDVPLRAALGSLAMIPCIVLLFLLVLPGIQGSEAAGLVLGLEILFIPILFRDARNLVGPVERPAPLAGPPGASSRLMASVAAIGPGFVSRLPRRLAEMGLLFEMFVSLVGLAPNVLDWAQITIQAVEANALAIGNWGWLFFPGLLLFLYAAGLMIMSDGLRTILTPEPQRAVAARAAETSLAAPPAPDAANP